jgi:transcriptional regulator NrdR family protein
VSALSQKVQACQKEKEDLEKKLPGIKQTLQDALNKQIPSEIFSYEDMINIIKDTVRLASYYKTYDSTLKALYLSDTASF